MAPVFVAIILWPAVCAATGSARSDPRDSAVVPLPGRLDIRIAAQPSPTIRYAADRIATELRVLYGIDTTCRAGPGEPLAGEAESGAIMVLGRAADARSLKRCPGEDLADARDAIAAPEGYRVIVRSPPLRIVVTAGTDVGVWYGACAWLDSLICRPDGSVCTCPTDRYERPDLAVRFTRGLEPRENFRTVEDAVPAMDWWARWRMNVTRIDERPEPFTRGFLREAHKRGIRVLLALGVRNLCASDDRAVGTCAGAFERFLRLGGDGVCVLWDDLPHERCAGHCDNCRVRFGANSLPREIAHVLEVLCDVASRHTGHPLILWCPSHYSESRYPEMSDDAFFQALAASPRVREQTHMFYCEFLPERLLLLDRVGIRNRVWWYNGMRTAYHLFHHWPTEPSMELSIPGVRTFAAPGFARFEMGWKTGIRLLPGGTIAPPPDAMWGAVRTVPQRYQGFYPCMDPHPYHGAASAVFAFSPRRFTQSEADRIVFRAIFGPGTEDAARRWSDAYDGLQVWLARAAGRAPSETDHHTAARRIDRWRELRRALEDEAARGRTLLAPDALQSVLARMRAAEQEVQEIFQRYGH